MYRLRKKPTTSKNSSLNDKSGNNEELIKIKKQTSWISSAVDINNSDNAPLDDSPLNTKEQTSLLSPPTNDNSSDGASISNDPLNNKEQTSFVSSIANENDMDDRLDTNEQSSFTSASSSINSSHGTHTNDSRLNNSERPSWTSRKRKISKSSTVDNSDSDSASSNNDSLNTKEQSLCRRCVGCLEVRVPIIWYFKMLIKSCSSSMPNKRQYASDKGWVQMTENFLETAPQTTILIYIILKTFNTGVIVDICFRIISVGFLCLSTVMYNQAIRKDQDIPPLILEWKILFWLLSFGQIGPRIVLLSSFAYELPFWFGVGIASHFFIMFITLFITVRNEQDICQNQCVSWNIIILQL
ncbi:XK-related protein [Popillia japonica]|uniref:XK-related protein n=1 Tax=Popillia japonica TaxID=7064 RepID=A0AAW1MJJ7_POPJA